MKFVSDTAEIRGLKKKVLYGKRRLKNLRNQYLDLDIKVRNAEAVILEKKMVLCPGHRKKARKPYCLYCDAPMTYNNKTLRWEVVL